MRWFADGRRALAAAALALPPAALPIFLIASDLAAQSPALAARSEADAWVPDAALAGRVRAAVADRWAVDAAAVRLEWGAVRASATPAGDAAFELVGAGAGGHWVVHFAPPEGPRVRLRAGVEAEEPVAARNLERGAALAAGDIARRAVLRWGPPRPAAAVVPGWVTRRQVVAGETLAEPAVEPPAAVRAGEPVRVVWSRGGISLELEGRAVGSAALGERVVVRAGTGRRLEGVATGPARVHVHGASEERP